MYTKQALGRELGAPPNDDAVLDGEEIHVNRLGARTQTRRSGRVLTLLLLVLALVAGACSSSDEGADGDPTPVATDDATDAPTDAPTDGATDDDGEAAALPAGTYRIGFQSLTSGPAAFAGVPLAQGARLAIKELNDTGALGEGVELELIEQDAGGDPAAAIAAVNGMLAEGVSGVLCCALSSVAGSVKPLLIEGQTPGIITSAILPGLPEAPYMYRPVLLLSETAYPQLVDAVVAGGGIETAVIGVTADNDGMAADADVWASALEDAGVTVAGRIDTSAGDTDFAGPATQVLDLNPDVFVGSLLGEEATLFIKALRDRGFEGEIISNYGPSNDNNYEVAGDALAGTKFPIAFSTLNEDPMVQTFAELYEAEYGTAPDIFAAQGYAAAKLLVEGIVRAGTGDAPAVAEALAGIDTFDSVFGTLTFNNGQAELAGDALLLEWVEGGTQQIFTGY